MKHVRESLKEFNNYKFFSLLEKEEEAGTDKSTLKSKEKNGLAIIDKITKNFDEFVQDAKGEILKYKEFWEENKQNKKGFSDKGNLYKLFNSDYVVGVLELPVQTLADGSIEGGLGASEEPDEEIIEGKEITQDEPAPDDTQPVTEAMNNNDSAVADLEPSADVPLGEPAPEETPTEEPIESPEETSAEEPVEEPTESPVEEPEKDLTAPQTYLVVYDINGEGEGREEIFRCGSNNVIKAFNAFYNDTFKGAMKDIIQQYHQEKEEEKVEAEKSEKVKKETEKEQKVQKFLGKDKTNENLSEGYKKKDKKKFFKYNGVEESLSESAQTLSFEDWLNDVKNYLIQDHDIDELDVDDFRMIAINQLHYFYNEGVQPSDAATEIAANEELEDKFEQEKSGGEPTGGYSERADEPVKKSEKYDYQKYNQDPDEFDKEQSLFKYLTSKKIKDFNDIDKEKSLLRYFKSKKIKDYTNNESLNEDINSDNEDDIDKWYSDVQDYLISDYEMEVENAEAFMRVVDEKLKKLYDGGSSAFDAAGIVASDEEAWEELEYQKDEEDIDLDDLEDEEELDDLDDEDIDLDDLEDEEELDDLDDEDLEEDDLEDEEDLDPYDAAGKPDDYPTGTVELTDD